MAKRPSPATLPFKGRLVEGDPDSLPPMVKSALDSDSTIEFYWRQDLTHDRATVPLLYSALNPLTYLGAPTGDYRVDGFAQLIIRRGEAVLGDYSAHTSVVENYNLFGGPTHRDVDRKARQQLDQIITRALDHDMKRLNDAAHVPSSTASRSKEDQAQTGR